MVALRIFVLLFWSAYCNAGQLHVCQNEYTVLTPPVALAGQPLVVWIHHTRNQSQAGEVIHVRLFRSQNEEKLEIITENKTLAQADAVVELFLPVHLSPGPANVQMLAECVNWQTQCNFSSILSIEIAPAIRSVEIVLNQDTYRPGDVVSWWILAVDHALKAIANTNAQVRLYDPFNTVIMAWDIPLQPGLKNMEFPLSQFPPLGSWKLEVIVNGFRTFRTLNVTQGKTDIEFVGEALLFPSHYVQVEFDEQLKYYAPFLPLFGTVHVVNTETWALLRIQVKEENRTLYETLLNVTKSHEPFIIPLVDSRADSIFLEAAVEAVEGEKLDGSFVLASVKLLRQGPIDGCHVVIHQTEEFVWVDEILNVTVCSNCPFEETVYYSVMSPTGHVVAWGSELIPQMRSNLTELSFSVPISSAMRPFAWLTAHFVTREGQLVQNTVHLNILARSQENLQLVTDEGMHGRNSSARIRMSTVARTYNCLAGVVDNGNVIWKPEPPQRTLSSDDCNSGNLDPFTEAGLPRNLFLEMMSNAWHFQCFEPRNNDSLIVEIQWPNLQQDLALYSFTLHPLGNFKISKPLRISKSLIAANVDIYFHLPPSVKVGEQLLVDVTLWNKLSDCQQVQLTLAVSGGALFKANGKKLQTETACLAPQAPTILRVRVDTLKSGLMTLTAQLKGYESNECCTPTINVTAPRHMFETTPISKTLLIQEPGLIHTQLHTQYFCLNEKSFAVPAEEFEYEIIPVSHQVGHVIMDVQASDNVYIALFDTDPASAKPAYRIVLGGEGNTQSWVARLGKQENEIIIQSAATPNVLSPERSETFWIAWSYSGVVSKRRSKRLHQKQTSTKRARERDETSYVRPFIAIGKGIKVGLRTIVMAPLASRPLLSTSWQVQAVGVATGWGTPGYFRFWGHAGLSDELSHTSVIESNAFGVLPGSLTAEIIISGGFHMPVLDEDSPTESLMDHLMDAHRWIQAAKDDEAALVQLVQNIVAYRRSDGSFVDLPHDVFRTTATSVLVLAHLRHYIRSDVKFIGGAVDWIASKQDAEGWFRPLANITDTYEDKILRTARVLIALADANLETVEAYSLIRKAQLYLDKELSANYQDLNSVLMSQALVTTKSSLTSLAIQRIAALDLDKVLGAVNEASLETVIGSLRVLAQANQFERAQGLAYWLMAQILVLPHYPMLKIPASLAIDAYTRMAHDAARDLTVNLGINAGLNASYENGVEEATDLDDILIVPVEGSLEDSEPYSINENKVDASHQQSMRLRGAKRTRQFQVKDLPSQMQFRAVGMGCATLQTKLQWQTRTMTSEGAFKISSVIHESLESVGTELGDPPQQITVSSCLTRGKTSKETIMKIQLMSTYIFDDRQTINFPYKLHLGMAYVFFPKVGEGFLLDQEYCLNLTAHRMGLAVKLEPGYIKVYDSAIAHQLSWQLLHGEPESTLLSGLSLEELDLLSISTPSVGSNLPSVASEPTPSTTTEFFHEISSALPFVVDFSHESSPLPVLEVTATRSDPAESLINNNNDNNTSSTTSNLTLTYQIESASIQLNATLP